MFTSHSKDIYSLHLLLSGTIIGTRNTPVNKSFCPQADLSLGVGKAAFVYNFSFKPCKYVIL